MDLQTCFAAALPEGHGDRGGVEATVGPEPIPDGFERVGDDGPGMASSARNFVEQLVVGVGAEGFETGIGGQQRARRTEERAAHVRLKQRTSPSANDGD